MKLGKLVTGIKGKKKNFSDREISSISIDSRKDSLSSLFIAWKGVNIDSNQFINQAITNGATAVIGEKEMFLPDHIATMQVENGREAYSIIAQNFYGNPSNRLYLIGVTGTTGKTTIAYLIYSILNRSGIKTGLIGTAGYYSGVNQLKFLLKGPVTTPEPIELNQLFSTMETEGCKAVVMEASSFGLEQNRLSNLLFSQAILSNLSFNHHINYHQGMKGYIESKQQLFQLLKANGTGIINADTEFFENLVIDHHGVKKIGIKEGYDYMISDFHQTEMTGISFSIQNKDEKYQVVSPLSGFFQAYNLTQAFVSCLSYGISAKEILHHITSIETIPGRFQFIKTTLPFYVLIDKANTPIAIRNIIPLLKNQHYNNHILVFGNVGGGDSQERRMMAKIFYQFFQKIIVSSDDPEQEDPMHCALDFLQGIPDYDKNRIIIELDRKKAIKLAIEIAKQNDLVAIFGRGNQQEFLQMGKTSVFDDIEITSRLIKEMEKKNETPHE